MKRKTIGLTLLLSLVAAAFCFAADNPMMGTWKLNESKSKLDPNGPKNNTVVYSAAGQQMKIIQAVQKLRATEEFLLSNVEVGECIGGFYNILLFFYSLCFRRSFW